MNNKSKKFAVMLFETEVNLGVPNARPSVYVNTKNILFENGRLALECYANTPCPASQLIDAEDDYELQCKMGEMILNYQSPEWLNENLFPYL